MNPKRVGVLCREAFPLSSHPLFVFYWRKPLLTCSTAPVVCWTCLHFFTKSDVSLNLLQGLEWWLLLPYTLPTKWKKWTDGTIVVPSWWPSCKDNLINPSVLRARNWALVEDRQPWGRGTLAIVLPFVLFCVTHSPKKVETSTSNDRTIGVLRQLIHVALLFLHGCRSR